MKSKVIRGIVLTVLLIGMLTLAFNIQPVGAVDWWPMFHHDPKHTSYSISTAPNNNKTVWSYNISGLFYSSAAVVNGKVFICGSSNVYALDASTGTKIWNTTIPAGHPLLWSSPTVENGRVFVGSVNGVTIWGNATIWALNETTGAKIWNYTTPVGPNRAPMDITLTAVNGKVFTGPIEETSKVYALNATTGAIVWSYVTGFSYSSDSSPAVADGVVFVCAENSVFALDETTGTHIWNYTTDDSFRWGSNPVVVNGMVLVGSGYGNVYALNETTGAHIWNFTTGMGVSTPAVTDGVVFVESGDLHAAEGKVYALNATTGEMLWNHTTVTIVKSSPAVADGKVFVGTFEGLHALNKTTGTEIWSYKIQHQKMYNSPAVACGKVFIALGGTLYAFGTPPVGGIYIPVNKLELLAPCIGLTILLAVAVVTVGHTKKRKRGLK